MKKTKNVLMAEMFACIAISLTIIALYETGTILPGSLPGNTNAEFFATLLMEALTICMVPLSLRLFKFKKISKDIHASGSRGLMKWGSIRMLMVCVPMMANTLLYYLFGLNVAFGYMGIICLICCIVFMYPSMSRCMSETTSEK